MAEMTGRIRTIKLSDGQEFWLFDNFSLHLGPNGVILCGDESVDKIVLAGYAFIESIDGVPAEVEISNVLTQDELTGEIKKRSTEYLLKDIGGYSLSVDNNTLIGKLGK